MNLQDKSIYDERWSNSSGTRDEDILVLSDPYDQVSFFYYQYNKFIESEIVKHYGAGQTSGKTMLEVGCGRGTSSIYQALNLNLQVFPIDYSESAVALANRNLRKYGISQSAVQADIFELPFPKDSFDIVISLGVMEHIEELSKAYRAMYDVINPGGLMISMNVPEKPTNVQRIAVPVNRMLVFLQKIFEMSDSKPWLDKHSRSKTSDVYRSELDSSEFSAIVRKAGFCEVNIFELNPFPTFDPVPRWLDFWIARFYMIVLSSMRAGKSNPFVCDKKDSRVHFIVATK